MVIISRNFYDIKRTKRAFFSPVKKVVKLIHKDLVKVDFTEFLLSNRFHGIFFFKLN